MHNCTCFYFVVHTHTYRFWLIVSRRLTIPGIHLIWFVLVPTLTRMWNHEMRARIHSCGCRNDLFSPHYNRFGFFCGRWRNNYYKIEVNTTFCAVNMLANRMCTCSCMRLKIPCNYGLFFASNLFHWFVIFITYYVLHCEMHLCHVTEMHFCDWVKKAKNICRNTYKINHTLDWRLKSPSQAKP